MDHYGKFFQLIFSRLSTFRSASLHARMQQTVLFFVATDPSFTFHSNSCSVPHLEKMFSALDDNKRNREKRLERKPISHRSLIPSSGLPLARLFLFLPLLALNGTEDVDGVVKWTWGDKRNPFTYITVFYFHGSSNFHHIFSLAPRQRTNPPGHF